LFKIRGDCFSAFWLRSNAGSEGKEHFIKEQSKAEREVFLAGKNIRCPIVHRAEEFRVGQGNCSSALRSLCVHCWMLLSPVSTYVYSRAIVRWKLEI
jgi:hypothetical protein